MFSPEVQDEIEAELRMAETARQTGNEGRARVCARRAAGVAIRQYLLSRRLPASGRSAHDGLRALRDLPHLPDDVRQVTSHLLMHVNEEHTLPVEVDLIAETRWLVTALAKLPTDTAMDTTA